MSTLLSQIVNAAWRDYRTALANRVSDEALCCAYERWINAKSLRDQFKL